MRKMTFFLLLQAAGFYLFAQVAHNMTLRGQWTDDNLYTNIGVRYNDVWGYQGGGRDYALVGSQRYVHFIDVNDPVAPREVARIGGGGTTAWRDIKTYGSYAYAVSESAEGLLVFDLSDLPNSVTKTAQLSDVFTSAHNLFIDGNFAFIVGAPQGTNRDLIIYDLSSDPANPTHLGSFSLNHGDGYVHDIFVEGTTAYASHGDYGLAVYDLSNTLFPGGSPPREPAQLGIFDAYFNPGYNHSSWVSGNMMVVADETHGSPLSIVDISDFEDMRELSYFQSNRLGVSNPYSGAGPIAHNPFIVGTDCYVSHYHDGVVVFDISNPANVEIAAYYDTEPNNTTYAGYTGCWGVYPFLGSQKILATDVQQGLLVLDKNNTLPNLPLPVIWGPLWASAEASTVRLDWSTYEEINNKGFHVERQDAQRDFVRIGWVAPELDQQYYFVDTQPLSGHSYYRLVQEDWDGKLQYSAWVNIHLATKQALRISPNPARRGRSIEILGETSSLRYPLQLYSADGRCWQQYPAADGHGGLSLPANLPSGSYYLVDRKNWRQQLIIN